MSEAAETPRPMRSQYSLSRSEILKGVANRWLFSHFYILFYLTMCLMSLTSVILSLASECPGLPFYVLEVIVNSAIIIEVCIRFVAFGSQFWKSYYNYLDIGITAVSVITVLVIFFSGCSAKGEEVFDDILLLVRNGVQFGRLALVLRRSGKSIFSRVDMIDLDAAEEADDYFTLDLDQEDEEAALAGRRRAGGDMGARASPLLGNATDR